MHVKLMTIMSPVAPTPATTVTNAATTSASIGKLDDEAPVLSPNSKQNYTKADLPFPRGGNHIYIWGKYFRPCLLSWAGSQSDPFGTNGMMHHKIAHIWACLYPGIHLDNQNRTIVLDVVHHGPLTLSKDSENESNHHVV